MSNYELNKINEALIKELEGKVLILQSNKAFLEDLLFERNNLIDKLNKRIAELESSEVVKWK